MLLLYSHETNWKIQLRHVLLRYSSALKSKITFAGILTPNSSSSYRRQRMASPSISCPSSGLFWALYGIQNDYATPLAPALCPMENNHLRFCKLASFLEGQTGVQSPRGNRFLGKLTCSVGLKLGIPSSLPSPLSSGSSEDAALLWLHTVSERDPRRMRIPRSQQWTFCSSIWTEQHESPLHCSITHKISDSG